MNNQILIECLKRSLERELENRLDEAVNDAVNKEIKYFRDNKKEIVAKVVMDLSLTSTFKSYIKDLNIRIS